MSIPFAFNYSREAVALLEAGAIEIDYWKCPPWPDLIREARQTRPVYVHFDLHAGDGRMETAEWGLIEQLLEDTGTPYLNLHLTPALSDFGLAAEPLTEAQNAQIVEVMLRDVGLAAGRFGAKRVIVENIPYRGKPERNGREFPRIAVEPAIFSRVLRETGTGLLFDIAHATITAHTLGVDVRGYIAAYPLDLLRELHVGGVRLHEGELEDHLTMADLDWILFAGMLGLIAEDRAATPWIVACEYGGLGANFAWRSESAVIAHDAPRIRQMLGAAARRHSGSNGR